MKMFVHCPNCGSGFDAFSQQEMEAPPPAEPPGPVHHFEMTESEPVTQPEFRGIPGYRESTADYIDDKRVKQGLADQAEIARLNAMHDAETALMMPEYWPGLTLEYDGTQWTGRRDHKVTMAPTLQGILSALHTHQL